MCSLWPSLIVAASLGAPAACAGPAQKLDARKGSNLEGGLNSSVAGASGAAEGVQSIAAPLLSVGEFLFTCMGYDAFRGPTGTGFVVTVHGDTTGYTVPLAVRYLPDNPSLCANYQVPLTGYPRKLTGANQTADVGNIVWGCQDRSNVINESAATDVICGEPYNDVIHGGGSADRINGMIGNDTITGDDGRDWIRGGKGSDSLDGGSDYDCVYGDLDYDTRISGGSDVQNSTDICQTGNGTPGTGSGETTLGCEKVDQPGTDSTCDVHFQQGWNSDYFVP